MDSSSIPALEHEATFSGHSRPINVVKLSPCGNFLLSGADDTKINIWNLDSLSSPFFSISHPGFGAVYSAVWAVDSDWCTNSTSGDSVTPPGMFVAGTSSGRIYVYVLSANKARYKLTEYIDAHEARIDDLAFDPTRRYLASAGGGEVRIWKLTSQGTVEQTPRIIPPVKDCDISRLFFLDKGSTLLSLYRERHLAVAYQVQPWAKKWEIVLPTRIGLASIGSDNRLVVTNLANGVDVYNIPPRVPIATLNYPVHGNLPIQSSVLEGSIVCLGSEDGVLTLWDSRANVKKQFSIGPRRPAQVVDSVSLPAGSIVVSASSGYGHAPEINLWSVFPEAPAPSPPPRQESVSESAQAPLTAIQLLVFAAFFVAVQSLAAHLPAIHDFLNAFLTYVMSAGGDRHFDATL